MSYFTISQTLNNLLKGNSIESSSSTYVTIQNIEPIVKYYLLLLEEIQLGYVYEYYHTIGTCQVLQMCYHLFVEELQIIHACVLRNDPVFAKTLTLQRLRFYQNKHTQLCEEWYTRIMCNLRLPKDIHPSILSFLM